MTCYHLYSINLKFSYLLISISIHPMSLHYHFNLPYNSLFFPIFLINKIHLSLLFFIPIPHQTNQVTLLNFLPHHHHHDPTPL